LTHKDLNMKTDVNLSATECTATTHPDKQSSTSYQNSKRHIINSLTRLLVAYFIVTILSSVWLWRCASFHTTF